MEITAPPDLIEAVEKQLHKMGNCTMLHDGTDLTEVELLSCFIKDGDVNAFSKLYEVYLDPASSRSLVKLLESDYGYIRFWYDKRAGTAKLSTRNNFLDKMKVKLPELWEVIDQLRRPNNGQ